MKLQIEKKQITVKELVYISFITVILEVAKIVLNTIPNVELVTLLVIVFTKQFGGKIMFPAVLLFSLIECMYWGFGTWSIVYFYMWPFLVLLVLLIKDSTTDFPFILLSTVFGLTFGAFCSLIILLSLGWNAAFSWWISGIPYDLIHGIANFFISLLLFNPINKAIRYVKGY